MAEVLCVYREVEVLKKASAKSKRRANAVAIVSYSISTSENRCQPAFAQQSCPTFPTTK